MYWLAVMLSVCFPFPRDPGLFKKAGIAEKAAVGVAVAGKRELTPGGVETLAVVDAVTVSRLLCFPSCWLLAG